MLEDIQELVSVEAAGGGGGGNHQSGAGGFSGGASEYAFYYKAGFDVRGIPGANGEGATGATRMFGGGGGYYTNGSQPWNSEAFKFQNTIDNYYTNKPRVAQDSYGACRYDQIKINGVPQYFLSITNNGAWNDEDVAGNGGGAGAGGTIYYTNLDNIHAFNGDRVTDGYYDQTLYEYGLVTNDESLYNAVNGDETSELTKNTEMYFGNNIVKVGTYATNTPARVIRKPDGSRMVPTKIFAQAGYIRPTYYYNYRKDPDSTYSAYEGNEYKLTKTIGSQWRETLEQNNGEYKITGDGLVVSAEKFNEYKNDLKDYRTLTINNYWTATSGNTYTNRSFTRVYTKNIGKRRSTNQYEFCEDVFVKATELTQTAVTPYGQGIGSGAGNLEKSNGQMIQITGQ